MLLSERYIRKIVKEELKGFLFESINARKDLDKYMSNLSKQSGVDSGTIFTLKSAIRNLIFANTGLYYLPLIYDKPKEQVTYGDVLQTLTTTLNLNTPLTLDGFSFSYNSNDPINQYMNFEESQEYYDAITLQVLKQIPSLNKNNIKSLISNLSKKEKEITKKAKEKAKEKEKQKKNIDLEKWSELEAPENAIFNKFAFSPQRQDSTNPPPKEPNNPVERRYLIAIKNHFHGNKLLSLETAQKLKELMQSGLYPDILKAPTKPVVYRGMTVRKEYLIDNLRVDADQIGSELKELAKTVTFRQTRHASSWTTDFEVAKDFADKNVKHYTDDIYSIVFEASVADNEGNLLDCNGLYDIKDIEEYDNEHEVISLEDIVASKMYIHKI